MSKSSKNNMLPIIKEKPPLNPLLAKEGKWGGQAFIMPSSIYCELTNYIPKPFLIKD